MFDRFLIDFCLHTLRFSHLIQSVTRIDIDSHITRCSERYVDFELFSTKRIFFDTSYRRVTIKRNQNQVFEIHITFCDMFQVMRLRKSADLQDFRQRKRKHFCYRILWFIVCCSIAFVHSCYNSFFYIWLTTSFYVKLKHHVCKI